MMKKENKRINKWRWREEDKIYKVRKKERKKERDQGKKIDENI
jgi:hypothetical protein